MVKHGKAIAGLIILAVGGATGLYLFTKKAQAQQQQYSIQITPDKTVLPSSGGVVNFSGTTNEPDNTTIYLFENNSIVDQTLVKGGAFTFSETLPPNTSSSPQTYTFFASDNTQGT